jgi:phosphoribosyl 1,2-cyclic phosphodiesterase
MGLTVKFWGVRGSIAVPAPNYMIYGGNTSCVEVRANGKLIILDAGTGIRSLGTALLKEGISQGAILFSHTHWDHINGFPFFGPAYSGDHSFKVFAGHLTDKGGIKGALSGQMQQPVFPVPIDIMHARMQFQDFQAGESFQLEDGVKVKTAPLNHPNGATGYRIEHGGRSVCYLTDTEHIQGRPDENILRLIDGADLAIYDCTYTDDEFPKRISWGHSTWQEGVRLCQRANVKKLAIFHHDPDHDDTFMAKINKEAQEAWLGAIVAREGMTIDLTSV